jgi:hypothetical protein
VVRIDDNILTSKKGFGGKNERNQTMDTVGEIQGVLNKWGGMQITSADALEEISAIIDKADTPVTNSKSQASRFLIDGYVRDADFAVKWLLSRLPGEGLNSFVVLHNTTQDSDHCKTFRSYLWSTYSPEELDTIANCGAACVGGLMLYYDTNQLYERFEDDIWQALYDEATEGGHNGVLELLSQGTMDPASDAQFRNLAVQVAAEWIVRDMLEDEGDED